MDKLDIGRRCKVLRARGKHATVIEGDHVPMGNGRFWLCKIEQIVGLDPRVGERHVPEVLIIFGSRAGVLRVGGVDRRVPEAGVAKWIGKCFWH